MNSYFTENCVIKEIFPFTKIKASWSKWKFLVMAKSHEISILPLTRHLIFIAFF